MPLLVQHIGGTGTSVTLGSPTTAGNTLIACITTITGTASAVKLGATSDTFIQDLTVANSTNPTANITVYIFRDSSCSGGQTSVTYTCSGVPAIDVYEVSGLANASPLDKSSTSQNGATSDTAPTSGTSPATTMAAEFWVGVLGAIAASGGTNVVLTGPSSPWTNESEQNLGSLSGHLSGYQVTSSAGTAAYAGTASPAAYSAGIVAAYAGVAPIPPPPSQSAPAQWLRLFNPGAMLLNPPPVPDTELNAWPQQNPLLWWPYTQQRR